MMHEETRAYNYRSTELLHDPHTQPNKYAVTWSKQSNRIVRPLKRILGKTQNCEKTQRGAASVRKLYPNS